METVLGGRYRLVALLGRGGMGEVWRGFDTTLGRQVAVKVMRTASAATPTQQDQMVKRFKREAQAIASLNHPNIVAAYDFGVDEESQSEYLVMELIDGETIATEVALRVEQQNAVFSVEETCAVGIDVCAALAYAHRAGVVHRDLKPANLMRDRETGRLKLVDFGIARGIDASRITHAGSWIGSAPYTAPEQLSGDMDGRADLYALACVLFELLTGGSPYDAQDAPQFLMAHMSAAPKRLRDYVPDAPAELDALIAQMLAKDPADRPANADEVATRLRGIITPAGYPTTPPGYATRPPGYATPLPGYATPPVSAPPVSAPPVGAPPVAEPVGATPATEIVGAPSVSPAPVAAVPSGEQRTEVVAAPTPVGPYGTMIAGVGAPPPPGGYPGAPPPGGAPPGGPPPAGPPGFPPGALPPYAAPAVRDPNRRTVIVLVSAIAAVLLVAGGVTAWALSGSPGGNPGATGGLTHSPGVTSGSPRASGGSTAPAVVPTAACGWKIAVIGALTGNKAVPDIARAAQLAVDDANAALHKPGCLTIAKFDTNVADVPHQAAAIMADTKILGVIGGTVSNEVTAMGPTLAAGDAIPFMALTATNSSLSAQGWKTFHRMVSTEAGLGAAAARVAAANGDDKIFIVANTDDYSRNFKTGASAAGSPVGTSDVNPNGSYADAVNKIATSGANAVIFASADGAEGAKLRTQLAGNGFTGDFIGGPGISSGTFVNGVGNAANTYYTCWCQPLVKSGKFFDAYRSTFGIAPPRTSDIYYDAAYILATGIGAGNHTRASLNTYLSTYQEASTINPDRTYGWAANGDLAAGRGLIGLFKLAGRTWAEQAPAPNS